MVSNSAVKVMENMIDELPMLPQVLVRILQLDPNAGDFFEEFGKLTKEDPAFAVRLIALANSSSSAPIAPIVSIREALTRMGAKAIRNLVASLAVQRVFLPTKPNEVRLWKHSVFAAFAASMIAEIASELRVDPAQAYLVGLLHDVGRFVMFEHAASELLKVDERNWETLEQLIEAEIEVFEFDHSELGFRACIHWKLPELICDVVRWHHTPIKKEIATGSLDAMLFCVQAADNLCLSILECDDFDDIPTDDRIQRIVDSCLKADQQAHFLSATVLAGKLDRIRADSQELLSGLGFN
jgi:putative nucleotidyltransferase with HDIG domain